MIFWVGPNVFAHRGHVSGLRCNAQLGILVVTVHYYLPLKAWAMILAHVCHHPSIGFFYK